jgi:hypothetical protein
VRCAGQVQHSCEYLQTSSCWQDLAFIVCC